MARSAVVAIQRPDLGGRLGVYHASNAPPDESMAAILDGLAGDLVLWHDTNAQQVPSPVHYALLVFGVDRQDQARIDEAKAEVDGRLLNRQSEMRERLAANQGGFPHLFLLNDNGVPHRMLLLSPFEQNLGVEGTTGEPPDYDLRNTKSFQELASLPFPEMILTAVAVHPEVIRHFEQHLAGGEQRDG